MAYKTCEDCGSRVYSGLCQNCDEEAVIFHQSSSEDKFSEPFMKKVAKQDNNRKNR